jgi:hypothetical protein
MSWRRSVYLNYIFSIIGWAHLLYTPRIELRTFCVLGRRDKRYTTETSAITQRYPLSHSL